jgi:tetratricopeptide (TPR) repeat protein
LAALAVTASGTAVCQHDEAREAQTRGAALHRSGDLQGALQEFDRVIRLSPRSSIAWYNRGLVRRDLRDCRAALADFSRALELEASNFNALYQRGNCLQAVGDYTAAIDDYTRASALPGQIHARFLAFFARGDASRRLGRLDDAYADYTRVLELRTDTTALRSRGWVDYYRGRWHAAHADMAKYLHGTDGKEPDAAYALIVGTLALQRANQPGAAAGFIAQWVPRLDLQKWPGPVVKFLDSKLDEDALLAAATESGQRTEARAYAGASILGGERREHGAALLRRVLREGDTSLFEYDLAYHELRRAGLAGANDRRKRSTQ